MMKKADIRSIIRSGLHIVIKPYTQETKEFTPCEFWCEDEKIWSKSRGLGTALRSDIDVDKLADHMIAMINEGFLLEIHA